MLLLVWRALFQKDPWKDAHIKNPYIETTNQSMHLIIVVAVSEDQKWVFFSLGKKGMVPIDKDP